MDHVDHISSKGHRRHHRSGRSALTPALLGIVSMALGNAAFPASAEPLALPRAENFIQVVGRAGPTRAWTNFCRSSPRECQVDVAEPAHISLTPQIWNTIRQVNEHVNSSIIAVTDQDHWGVVDRWDYPDDGLGDCEDIQLLKRRMLVQAGLPRRAMRMAVVMDERGEGHAVLMVLTDRGDFVLDNKRKAVLAWRQTGYTFIKREGTNSKTWVALGDVPAPVATANR
jgi:predicted transglutaminase-like cysteine proteinase